MRAATLILGLMLLPLAVQGSEPVPFDLVYPTATPASAVEEEGYDHLEVKPEGQGYLSVYGHTWEQNFQYPKFQNGAHEAAVKGFVSERLGLPAGIVNGDGFGHFHRDGHEYWLKLSTFAQTYSYVLLRVTECPDLVSLGAGAEPEFTLRGRQRSGPDGLPPNLAIPQVAGFAIDDVDYKNFDEHTFYYDRQGHLHEGRFWEIDFEKTQPEAGSGRYAIAHDYKRKILALGASVLLDDDNEVIFRWERDGAPNIIRLKAYDSSFSVIIIQEEAFRQSLVLTPDAIKAELDQTGRITLDGVFFDFDQATLKPASDKALLSAVALLQKYPDLCLSVHGYTDDRGSDDYNARLSGDRAAAVRQALVHRGIDGSRLTSRGHGEDDPVAGNDTDEGRAQNRRVELHKVSGGDQAAVITIDFIKPLTGSVIDSRYSYDDQELGIESTPPYAPAKGYQEYGGHLEVISYRILKDGEVDTAFSRKEIIRNYANVLDLYNAELLGNSSNNLSFRIADRGDGVTVYGRIEAYDGTYTIRFLAAAGQ